jgi:hypothetical protein
MATSFHWHITDMNRQTQDGYVFSVAYAVKAIGATFSTVCHVGSIELPRGETMIPFENLTKETVVSWVKDKLGAKGVTDIEDYLQKCLNDRLVASAESSGLPWS